MKKNKEPWNGKEAVVIDGHFDNPKREWNGDRNYQQSLQDKLK